MRPVFVFSFPLEDWVPYLLQLGQLGDVSFLLGALALAIEPIFGGSQIAKELLLCLKRESHFSKETKRIVGRCVFLRFLPCKVQDRRSGRNACHIHSFPLRFSFLPSLLRRYLVQFSSVQPPQIATR